jgi:ferrous iron transport protein B
MTGAAAARRIALVGRANAGKTSLLMHLTGTLQRPVNFPGSSVECVASDVVEGGVRLCVVDLPGLASLQAQSSDEQAALDALQGRAGPAPDLLCAVLDASKLAVELAFLRQLRRLGRPLVVALTKTDVAASEGFPVDAARLQLAIGLPLVVVDESQA